MNSGVIGVLALGIAVFAASYHYSKQFLDWLRFQSLGTRDYIVETLAQMFVEISPEKVLIALFAVSFGCGSLVFLAFLPQLFPAILFGAIVTVIGWYVPKPFIRWLYRRRIEKMVLQMVDGLNLMSNGLKSGLSVVQALGLVVQEMPNPLQQEFNLILSQNKLGVSLEEAFNNFAERVKNDDVEMFVTSINILKETGGNLAETFDTIVTTIRERIKVEKKISAMVAQGFMQGMILCAVPPMMGSYFYLSDPEFMSPMFTTTVGWLIICVILLLEVVGFFAIMKVIKIDV